MAKILDICLRCTDSASVANSSLTAKRRLADTLLDGGLSAYVARRRGAEESWRQISLAIREEIALDIHPETLRLWFAEEIAAAS